MMLIITSCFEGQSLGLSSNSVCKSYNRDIRPSGKFRTFKCQSSLASNATSLLTRPWRLKLRFVNALWQFNCGQLTNGYKHNKDCVLGLGLPFCSWIISLPWQQILK